MGLLLQNINKVVGPDNHLNAINLEFAPGSRNVILEHIERSGVQGKMGPKLNKNAIPNTG